MNECDEQLTKHTNGRTDGCDVVMISLQPTINDRNDDRASDHERVRTVGV